MKNIWSIRFALPLLIFILQFSQVFANCGPEWRSQSQLQGCDLIKVSTVIDYPFSRLMSPGSHRISAKLRAGFIPEISNAPFRGNILYFEGLGDAIVNHLPLFRALSVAGYRIIAFDYFGQGGSSGSMNDTRIWDIPKNWTANLPALR